MVQNEEVQAQADAWKLAFGFINSKVVKAAVELEIQDALEKLGGSASLSDLATAVGVVEPNKLRRIMRFLIHLGLFKKTGDDHYAENTLSRLFTRDKMAPFMMMQMTLPSESGVTAHVLRGGERPDVKPDHGEDTWSNPEYGYQNKVFTDAMETHSKVTTSAIIANHPDLFKGVRTVVDVGGRHGMALSRLIKAFPWVQGTCFDLPEVVAKAPPREGIHFVGGSMFETVPKADAIMLMSILHDWSDSACVEILKKCKEAIPPHGKVVIVDAVVEEEDTGDEHYGARLGLDMVIMAMMVNGQERTHKEFARLLDEAGFSRHTVTNIKTVEGVIEAYP